MYCSNCGSKLKDGQNFCGVCGAAVRSVEPDSMNRTHESTRYNDRSGTESLHNARAEEQLNAHVAERNLGKRHVGLIVACAMACAVAVFFVFFSKPSTDVPIEVHEGKATEQSASAIADSTGTNPVEALVRPSLIKQAVQPSPSTVVAAVEEITIQPDLTNVSNVDDVLYPRAQATNELKKVIAQNGFAIDASYGSYEFFDVYEQNRYAQTPSFVTVDSMMHTYHLYFQHLQKNTERNHLASTILSMSQQLLSESEKQFEALKGTEWENAAKRNLTFFAVGASLQDTSVTIPQDVAQMVSTELSNIQSAEGMRKSVITDEMEDYTQYKVRGYYEGDPLLEQYFRTMMWYGRINFVQKNEDMDRSALLMTLALKGEALRNWEATYAVTSFFAGASDDNGYCEYQPILEAAYGTEVTVSNLAGNDEAWQRFHQLTAQTSAPQINSVPLGDGDDPDQKRTEAEKGFRLMGQRFSIDEMIFTQLLHPNIGTNSNGAKRFMPDATDVPAALGSDEALQIARERGATDYAGYEQKVETLRSLLKDESASHWSASLYSQWLYTLNPLLQRKGEGYPTFMQSNAWARKNLQSYLGSYTELKHDSVLYSKQVMAEGGGMVEKLDDRGYVETEPEVFERLANLTTTTSEGLSSYGLLGSEDAENLERLSQLAHQLKTIADKELSGDKVTDEEYELIRSYGVQLEHFWKEVYKNETDKKLYSSMEFPSAVVCDIATNGDAGTVLEVGTGRAMSIYVVVPVEGSLRLAKGSVFSFYQFEQPMSQRLTDSEWRDMLSASATKGAGTQNMPSLEDWTDDFTVVHLQ